MKLETLNDLFQKIEEIGGEEFEEHKDKLTAYRHIWKRIFELKKSGGEKMKRKRIRKRERLSDLAFIRRLKINLISLRAKQAFLDLQMSRLISKKERG